jgi:hypothetical protein
MIGTRAVVAMDGPPGKSWINEIVRPENADIFLSVSMISGLLNRMSKKPQNSFLALKFLSLAGWPISDGQMNRTGNQR